MNTNQTTSFDDNQARLKTFIDFKKQLRTSARREIRAMEKSGITMNNIQKLNYINHYVFEHTVSN